MQVNPTLRLLLTFTFGVIIGCACLIFNLEMRSNVYVMLSSSFMLGLMIGFIIWQIDLLQVRPYQQPIERRVPLIYIITPTHKCPTRYPDFLRLLHTLLHLENIYWLVVEDGSQTDGVVEELLSAYDIRHTYFAQNNTLTGKKRSQIKGVDQRNAALNWIRLNHNRDDSAVIYFADDDNTYSLELFDEIRFTQKISIFPVGLLDDEIIIRDGKVVGFGKQKKKYQRKFAVDMASFAINVDVLFKNPYLQFVSNYSNGYLETKFLEQFTDLPELEPKANNCTKVMVWHTRTCKACTSLRNFEP